MITSFSWNHPITGIVYIIISIMDKQFEVIVTKDGFWCDASGISSNNKASEEEVNAWLLSMEEKSQLSGITTNKNKNKVKRL